MSDLTGLGQALDSDVAKKFYEESLSPAAKPLGLLLRDSMQSVRLGLFPLQLFATGQTILDKFLEYVAAKISPENLIAPPPEVAGPVLQGLVFVREENPVREMFAELLARACDKTRVGDAHPAFAKIIDQLSPDEAVILRVLKTETPYLSFDPPDTHLGVRLKESLALLTLIAPENIPMYLSHLVSLNLLTWSDAYPMYDWDELSISAKINDFGKLFMDACVPGHWPPDAT